MSKPKVLCVCTMSQNRRKYLAKYLQEKGYETKYGGIDSCKIDPEPINPASSGDVEWAEIIITARKKHEAILRRDYSVKEKRIIVLDVTDSQKRMAKQDLKYKKMNHSKFNQELTYPQLRKEIEHYLPLEIEE